jgi:hypothetical protein
MTPTLAPPDDLAGLTEVADAVLDRWAAGEPPDALAALAEHPALAARQELVVQLAYEEFCLRAEAGRPPDAAEFAARFPFREAVAELLKVGSVVGKFSFGRGRRPAVTLAPGDTVGDLRVLRHLGRGGFSDVYLVRNEGVGDRTEVLKVSTRGEQEARTLGRLSHPHLMPVNAAPTVAGHRAVLSPYRGLATGETLVRRANGRPPTAGWLLRVVADRRPNDPPVADPPPFAVRDTAPYPRAVLRVLAALADALRYLHAAGIAHRDLKPSNVLFAPTAFPYLLDLNLADDGPSARAGGTAAYAAPEVLARMVGGTTPPADHRPADLFSFAVTAFELLLTRHPYLTAPDATGVAEAAAAAHRTLAGVRLDLPPRVRRVLLACLAPDPTARPTADELARTLAIAVAVRPKRRWVVATAAAVALVLAGTGAAGWAARGGDREPVESAQREPVEPFARGLWHVNNNDPDLAIVHFRKAAETDTTGKADEWLGYCFAHTGSHDTAIKHCTLAEKAGRLTSAVYANRAASELLRAKDSDAAADAAAAIALDPSPQARLTRSLAVFRLLKRDTPFDRGTLAEIERGIAGNEDNSTLWAVLAEARVRVKDATDEDRTSALDAVKKAMLNGTPRLAFEMNPTLVAAFDGDSRFAGALTTAAKNKPSNVHAQLIRPE